MYITTPQDFDICCVLAYLLQNYGFIYQSVSIALDIKDSLNGLLAIFHSAELFLFTRIQCSCLIWFQKPLLVKIL